MRGYLGERGGVHVANDGDEQSALGVHGDAEMDAFGEQEMILRPGGGEHGMLSQGGGGELDEDVVDGGNDGEVRFFAHGLELLAEGEDLGGIATSGDGDGDGGLPAVHEPRGDDAAHLRERHPLHAGG